MTSRDRGALAVLLEADLTYWLRAIAWAGVIGLAIAIPTVLIENSWFRRMTPTRWWDYVLWVPAAGLAGMTISARRLPGAGTCRVEGRTFGGAGLAYLAVGCPICNKIVVSLLGVSGALSYFAPIQPILGVAGMTMIVLALRTALRAAANGPPDRPTGFDVIDLGRRHPPEGLSDARP